MASSRSRRVEESAYPPTTAATVVAGQPAAYGYAESLSSNARQRLPLGAAAQPSSYHTPHQQRQHQQHAVLPNTPAARSYSNTQPSVGSNYHYRSSGSDEGTGGDTTMSTSHYSGGAHSEAHLINAAQQYSSSSYTGPAVVEHDYDHRTHACLPPPPQQDLYSPPPAPHQERGYGGDLDAHDDSRYTYTEDKLLNGGLDARRQNTFMSSDPAGLRSEDIDMSDKRQGRRTGAGTTTGGGGAAAGGDGGVSTLVKGYGTPHQIAFLSVVLLQTLASVAMIAIVWAKIRAGTPQSYEGLSSFFSGSDDETALRRRSITVYLAIFLFGSAFEIITAIDALRLNNTIQLIGVCLFVVAMMVYAALLDGQIENAISITDGYSPELYPSVRPYIIAMPIIQGVAVLVLAYFTYKLFRDFGWEVLHLIGADRKLKRIYTKYQIFVCLVKFDFFFFVGFSLQYMILVLKVQEAEFIITIIAFPFTILALVLAVIAVRRENRSLSYVIFIAELAALAYFVFKFFRLFQPSQAYRYQTSRKTLAVFSALAIVMLLSTFWVSVLCFRNYGNGLREAIPGYFGEHRASRRQRLARKNSQSAGAVLAEQPTRMSID